MSPQLDAEWLAPRLVVYGSALLGSAVATWLVSPASLVVVMAASIVAYLVVLKTVLAAYSAAVGGGGMA